MSIEVKVYDNGDHTCLVWMPEDGNPIKDCRGFAIERLINGKIDYLHGFAGFTDQDKATSNNAVPDNCLLFPIQRYLWWDYYVTTGDQVQYTIIPITGKDRSSLALDKTLASAQTPALKITGQDTQHISSYFNKGIVAAQWVSRALAKEPTGQKLKDLVAKPGDPLREALTGLLLPAIQKLLTDAKTAKAKVYAALYELNDPDLIDGLKALGQNCNLILANGAFKSNQPPGNDENSAVRATLKNEVNLIDRIVPSGHFAHNKFVVVCDAGGKPLKVLTGSTNWTSTGLCTQANNSIIVDDPDVAAFYLDYWNRIEKAKDAFPADYISANSTAKTFTVDDSKITPWCVPTTHAQDLEFARKLIANAKDGILFLFFNPGVFEPATKPLQWTLLQNILSLQDPQNPDGKSHLYIRGVVNQEIPQLTEPAQPKKGTVSPQVLDPSTPNPVTLYTGGNSAPQGLSHDVMVPRNIKNQFHEFEKEQLGASMVNIHSKVIVIDPFGDHPVVMTGSHNLGFKASSKNDDNLIIIEGNAPLAAAYAINIIAIFQNYRWNSYVEAHRNDPKVWHGPVDNDQWQSGHLTGDGLEELEFWLGGTHDGKTQDESNISAPQSESASTEPSLQAPSEKKSGQVGKKTVVDESASTTSANKETARNPSRGKTAAHARKPTPAPAPHTAKHPRAVSTHSPRKSRKKN